MPSGRVVAYAVIVAAIIAGSAVSLAVPGASGGTITLSKPGLVASDSLTTGSTSGWVFGGDAASHNYYEDSQGLHIGAHSPADGTWAGYYAVRRDGGTGLFHARLSLPSATTSSQAFNVGLYAQSGGPGINYVSCVGQATPSGYYWAVVQATGSGTSATSFNNLYFKWMGGQPLTRDCTIVTDGSSLLEVYLDGTLVYSNSSMNLGYVQPLEAFIEVQTSHAGDFLYGTFADFYSTTGGNVRVQNVPPGDVAKVNSGGSVLASGTAGTSGAVDLSVAQYHMPVSGSVDVYDANGALIASTGQAAIWGGDAYTATVPQGSTTTTTATSPPTTSTTALSSSLTSFTTTAPPTSTATSTVTETYTTTTSTGITVCLPIVGCISP